MILGVACEDDGHFSAVTYLVDAALLAEHEEVGARVVPLLGSRSA